MKKLNKVIFAGWCAAFSSLSFANGIEIINVRDSGVRVKSVTAGGSGCVGGNVELSNYDPDALGTLEFRNLQVNVRQNKSIDRKSCNLVVALQIPRGYEVGLPVATAAGLVENRGASIQLRSEFFFLRGGSADPKTVSFSANAYKFFEMPVSLPFREQAWSGCQTEALLRMNISLTARTTSYYQSGFAEVSEIKIISPDLAGLKLRRCR